jgi:hypothetical protein
MKPAMRYNPQPPSDLDTGLPWSKNADRDLRAAPRSGVEDIAVYPCRTEQEVRDRARELGVRLSDG